MPLCRMDLEVRSLNRTHHDFEQNLNYLSNSATNLESIKTIFLTGSEISPIKKKHAFKKEVPNSLTCVNQEFQSVAIASKFLSFSIRFTCNVKLVHNISVTKRFLFPFLQVF